MSRGSDYKDISRSAGVKRSIVASCIEILHLIVITIDYIYAKEVPSTLSL